MMQRNRYYDFLAVAQNEERAFVVPIVCFNILMRMRTRILSAPRVRMPQERSADFQSAYRARIH
jgi:hypothetical protein